MVLSRCRSLKGTQVNHNRGRSDRSANSLCFMRMRSVWKWVGLAGAAGVVAGGALVVRDQRKRRSYTADEVRARLHQRLAESEAESLQSASGSAEASTANKR